MRILTMACLALSAATFLGCRSEEEKRQDRALQRLVVVHEQRALDSVARRITATPPGAAQDRLAVSRDSIARELAEAVRDAKQ